MSNAPALYTVSNIAARHKDLSVDAVNYLLCENGLQRELDDGTFEITVKGKKLGAVKAPNGLIYWTKRAVGYTFAGEA